VVAPGRPQGPPLQRDSFTPSFCRDVCAAREFHSKPSNPLQRAEDPEWQGARDYTARLGREVSENLILAVDGVRLLVNEGARI
jgi:hypothetical protein